MVHGYWLCDCLCVVEILLTSDVFWAETESDCSRSNVIHVSCPVPSACRPVLYHSCRVSISFVVHRVG